MRIAYLDCLSGISGDMMLGALIDAGVDIAQIQAGVDSLGLPSCRFVADTVSKCGFRATNVNVQYEPEHTHRHLHHITEMIDQSQLTTNQKDLAKRIFTKLGEAEAKVHGCSIEKVHFHEVGAVDSIADIVGTAIGWDLLGVDRIECSSIPTGTGTVKIAHGTVSIPAPATAELLTNIPLAQSEIAAELTTPTGAAIAATIVDKFGSLPAMQIKTVAFGAGDRDLESQPNVLRLLIGETEDTSNSTEDQIHDEVWVLETNIDDMTGEAIGHCCGILQQAGVLDVYTTAIQMKKNRPGVTLTALCHSDSVAEAERIMFEQTTTLGIRKWTVQRHILQRQQHT
ncbi:MAG: nickel pincer cofactor biosynthesis protein LarC, partial [Pirellulales bacterium]